MTRLAGRATNYLLVDEETASRSLSKARELVQYPACKSFSVAAGNIQDVIRFKSYIGILMGYDPTQRDLEFIAFVT